MHPGTAEEPRKVTSQPVVSRSGSDPTNQATDWNLTPEQARWQDEVALENTLVGTLTCSDVEDAVGRTMPVIKGSCRFTTVTPRDRLDRVRFRLMLSNRQMIFGAVVMFVATLGDSLSASSVIELDPT